MTKTTESTARSKEQLYDTIGQCNLRIVELEHLVPELESQLIQWSDAPDLQDACRESIHENKQMLERLKEEVRKCRNTIATRLELEVEELKRQFARPHLYNYESTMQQVKLLQEEAWTLRKLTSDGATVS
jgi:sensor histidine kinase YesM